MTHSNGDFDFSSYSEAQFAFESIGASAWRARLKLLESRLAASVLIGSFFEHRSALITAGACARESCKSIFQHYEQLEEDTVHSLREEVRRSTLLTAISVLDSFLSDSLRFLFLHMPHTVPNDVPEKKHPGESDADFVERIVRRSRRFSSQSKRLSFLSAKFNLALDEALLAELSRLTNLRNEVSHHSGFYRFVVDPGTGKLRSEEKPLPPVTENDATKVTVIVGEVCDTIFEAMSLTIFSANPIVRPVNPEAAALHKTWRQQWAEQESKTPVVEEFTNPRWAVKSLTDSKISWVGDEVDAWIIIPSSIDLLPPSIKFQWNTRYGMRAWVTVDENPRKVIEGFSREIVDQMGTGQTVLVEYYDWRDGPQFARFSLTGFAEAWSAACERQARE